MSTFKRFMCSGPVVLALGVISIVFAPNASAQLAPTGDHYGGRPSDTGFSGKVNATGGYSASVPLDLPPPRGGLPLLVQIVSGGRNVGAAGLGWDIPLSYVRVDTSLARRKPKNLPNAAVQGRQRVSVSLAGQPLTLVPKGSVWVSQTDNGIFTASRNGASWLVYDGQGHKYSFTQPAGHTGIGLWLLTSVTGPGGTMMTLTYNVQTVALTGGHAMSIDLTSASYNFNPNTGCGKDLVELSYGNASATPLSITVAPSVIVRMHTLSSVAVESRRSTCASVTTLRRYAFAYAPDVDTQLPRLQRVTMYGRDGTPEASTPLPIARCGCQSPTRQEWRTRFSRCEV